MGNRKSTKILFFVGDAGAAEALAPVIASMPQETYSYEVFADPKGAGFKTLTKLKIPHQVSENVNPRGANLVVCGTNGKAQGLQIQTTNAARSMGIPVLWVGDFYGSGGETGVANAEPTVLTVIDQTSADLLKKVRLCEVVGTSNNGRGCKLHITGNPAFDELASLKKRRDDIRVATRAALGLDEKAKLIVFGGSASNQFDVEDMLRTLGELTSFLPSHHKYFSLHPADPNREELENCIRTQTNCSLFADNIDMYAAADAVVVQYSTIGIKSALLGVPTLFALLPSLRTYQRSRGNTWPYFPQIKMGAAEMAATPEEIQPILHRMLSQDEPDYHAARLEAIQTHFPTLIDGDATRRIIELMHIMSS